MEEEQNQTKEKISAYRKEITNEILSCLKQGISPWTKPWNLKYKNFMLPINGLTGKRYNGGNVIHLQAQAIRNNYEDPRWYTFNQVKRIPGAHVKQYSKGTIIFFFEPKGTLKRQKNGKTFRTKHSELFMYFVFNAEQIEGLEPFDYDSYFNNFSNERADNIVKLNDVDIITHDLDKAFYRPSEDKIYLPPKTAFLSEEKYYATLLHEVSHSTGHQTRLKRNLTGQFGSENYAREELIAEMASMFLCYDLGIKGYKDIENHAAYIQSWISLLEKDENELFKAAASAEKVCKYLYGLEKNQKTYTSKVNQVTYKANNSAPPPPPISNTQQKSKSFFEKLKNFFDF